MEGRETRGGDRREERRGKEVHTIALHGWRFAPRNPEEAALDGESIEELISRSFSSSTCCIRDECTVLVWHYF